MRAVAVILLVLAPSIVRGQDEPDSSQAKRKIQIFVHGSYQPTARTFEVGSSSTQFLELGSTRGTYSGGTGTAFEFGGAFALTTKFALLGSLEAVKVGHDANLDVSVPHPLFFDRPRTASMAVDGLEHSELAVHLGFAYRIAVARVEIDLFVGPSIFSTETEVIEEAISASEYPFDDLSLTGASRVTMKDIAIGFNTGAGIAYYVTESIGVSFMARFSQAAIEVMPDGSEAVSFTAGGLRAGGGIRFRF